MKFSKAVVSILLVMVFCLFFSSNIAAKTLRFAHYAPVEDVMHEAAMLFANRVRELSNNTIQIQIFPANELGPPHEYCEQLRLGVIDIAIGGAGQLQEWVPEFAAVQLPFQFDSVEHTYRVFDGQAGEILAKMAEKERFIILSHWEFGFRAFSNNVRPINSVEDMVGLKMRVPPEIPMQAAMLELGAIPVQLAFPELYMALSQGVVDGQENPIHYMYYTGLHEQQKYISIPGPGYMYHPATHIVGKNTWDRLTDEEQEIFKLASFEARDWTREVSSQRQAEALEIMIKAGLIVTRPDPEPFRVKLQPAWKTIADYAGHDFIASWSEIVDELR